MPREVELSLNEREFIANALRENIRMDGRPLDAYRSLSLEFGEEYGVADVRLGKTRVVTRISAEVTTPFPDRKFDGIFQISTELSPMASPAFEIGRQTDTEVLLSRLLEKSIRRSGALDTESLCIIAGSKCFALRADIHVLDHDGNLIDACCIALVAALQHFRRPDVSVEGEEVTVYDIREREPVKLAMQHHPFCVSFSYYHDGDIVLIDADLAEENVRDGEIVVSMNRHGEVCQIAKYGGASVEPLTMLNCTTVAHEKVKVLHQFVQAKLDQDEKKRDKGGLMAELSSENARELAAIPG
ncbi:ribosomal protein S5 domain 2-type protein [Delphinella strobiligena]|nr:ribosomal protein S5 domain 2-type protein [Delphinella strobiligena]